MRLCILNLRNHLCIIYETMKKFQFLTENLQNGDMLLNCFNISEIILINYTYLNYTDL